MRRKATDRLADKWLDIATIRQRRMLLTLLAASATGVGALVTNLTAGSLPLALTGGAAPLGLAAAGRRKDGAGGRKAVVGPRTLAWVMHGDHTWSTPSGTPS